MAEGFLGRWSQRKLAVREGKPADSVGIPPAVPGAPAAERPPVSPAARPVQTAGHAQGAEPVPPGIPAAQPEPPSMQDVAALHAESDFKPFVARAVSPEVRNAAMKKLFADPHFNVMDGLDIYIDDYSQPDPIPPEILAKLQHAREWLMDDATALPAPEGATAPVDGERGRGTTAEPATAVECASAQAATAPGGRCVDDLSGAVSSEPPQESGQNAP